MTPSGALATLYSFPGPEGNPTAPLVEGTDGNFYGTATESIFKITAAGAITTLYTFCALPGCADGANLDAGLIQATDGNFYGTTSAGGAYGNYGTIFKITLAGQLTTLHSFSSTDGAIPGGGLIQATDGNFYGTAGGGGANGYGTVFRITPAGQLTTLHSFNSADGANPSGVLVQGKAGSFYGTTEGGGSSNAGTIFSLSVPMTATPTPTYGTAARVFQDGGQWPDNTIYIFGDLGKVQSELVESTTSGFQAADPKITAITTVNPAGLSSGALSYSADSSDGAARGLAFRNFINNTGAPLTMKLNAVLSGYFLQEDGYTGYGSVAGAIHIFDGTTFASRVKASGETAGQFLLANYPSTTAFQGATVIDTLDNLFPGPALAGGYVALEGEPAGSAIWIANTYGIGPISGSVSTSLFTVEPQQTITVIFDVATATAGGPFGTGEVYFLDTLQPAANFFSDANGNAVSGMAAVDAPAPASLPVSPAALVLAPATATNLAGTADTVTATATDTNGNAVPGAIVKFTVTSGPNAGVVGGAITGGNGQAVFSYTGTHGAGPDTIQASIGTVASNAVQETWTLALLPSGSACNGTYNGTFAGDVTVRDGQTCVLVGGGVTGDIIQNGGSLTIGNFTVSGNVHVDGRGTFSIGPYTTIDGNLDDEGAVPRPRFDDLRNHAPLGARPSIGLSPHPSNPAIGRFCGGTRCGAGTAPSQVCRATVKGNLWFRNNRTGVQIGSASPSCAGNAINGNLEVQDSTGFTAIFGNTVLGNLEDLNNAGPTQVFDNTVTNNLQCQDNRSITGGGNTAGLKEGQCAAF